MYGPTTTTTYVTVVCRKWCDDTFAKSNALFKKWCDDTIWERVFLFISLRQQSLQPRNPRSRVLFPCLRRSIDEYCIVSLRGKMTYAAAPCRRYVSFYIHTFTHLFKTSLEEADIIDQRPCSISLSTQAKICIKRLQNFILFVLI